MKATHIPPVRVALGVAILALLAGCANSPSWGAWSKRPTDAQVAAVMARTADQPAVAQASDTRAVPTTRVAAISR